LAPLFAVSLLQDQLIAASDAESILFTVVLDVDFSSAPKQLLCAENGWSKRRFLLPYFFWLAAFELGHRLPLDGWESGQ
jgi:hypothetical protein